MMAHNFRKTVVGVMMCVGCSAALMACGEDAEPLGPGSVEISWELKPETCASAGVKQVNIQLVKDEVSTDHLVACDAGDTVLTDVDPAKYDLTVLGLNEDGRAIFTSDTTSISVKADSLMTVESQHLRAKPPVLTVAWKFENGLVCGANGVTEINVVVYNDQSFELANQTFTCADGMGVVSDLKVSGKFTLMATAEGAQGGPTFTAESEVDLERGEEKQVILELKPNTATPE